jgi:hypothetical protein
MVAKIPDPLDYGARPSLRTARVDRPDRSGSILADSLANAATNFANVMADRKDKQDKLTYTRLKTQLLTEDIAIRRELIEAGEFETYEDDYRERIAEVRERLQGGITNAHDATIFDADAGLLVERGATDMHTAHFSAKADFEVAEMERGLGELRHALLAAKSWDRREILLDARDLIQARRDAHLISEGQALAYQQAWVSDVAKAELANMDPKERAIFLERAIEGNMDPTKLTAEGGTGSLADFLPQDVRIEMLRQTKQLIEAQDSLDGAQGLFDKARSMFQANTAENDENMLQYIRKNSTGETRRIAEQLVRQDIQDRINFKARKQAETVSKYTDIIMTTSREGDDPSARSYFSVSSIPRDEWMSLEPGQRIALEQLAVARQQGRSNALATQNVKILDESGNEMPSYSLWRRMTDAEKIAVDLDSADWLMAFNETDWRALQAHQEQLRGGGGLSYADGLTNDQMLHSVLTESGWVAPKDRPPEDDIRFARARIEFDKRVQAEMRLKKVPKLENPERMRILGEILREQGYTNYDIGIKGGLMNPDGSLASLTDVIGFVPNENSRLPLNLMNAEQREVARVPIAEANDKNNPLHLVRLSADQEPITVYEMLRIMATNPVDPKDPSIMPGLGLPEPKTKDIERAIAAWYGNWGEAEIERRLRGE